MVGMQIPLGSCQQFLACSQAARHGKSVAHSRHTVLPTVSRQKSIFVEFGRRILYALGRMCKNFKLGIMRCGHGIYPLVGQLFQNRRRQRRPFGGIGAAAQFVKQQQITAFGAGYYADNVLHVRRKGG